MRTFSSAWGHSSGKAPFSSISFPLAAFVSVCACATFVTVYAAAAFLSQTSAHLSSPLINLHSAALRIPSCFSPLPLPLLLLLISTSACGCSHEAAISGEFFVECEPVCRFNSLSPSAEWLLKLCCVICLFFFRISASPCPIDSLEIRSQWWCSVCSDRIKSILTFQNCGK